MRKILLIISILFVKFLFAQGTGNESNDAAKYIPKISPASPEAFKFGNYGNIPVGLFTGTPNINIPLAIFESGKIKIPISLNYSSNGIHVDEMNGSVGLGWTLISAGVITRTVRGLPDEKNSSIKTLPDIDKLGLWSPDVVNYLNDCQYGIMDSEPDLYTANFCGNSIKFVFDTKGMPILYSQSNFIIEGTSGGGLFVFTQDNGTKYFFSEHESVINRTQGNGHSIPESHVSAWYLSKITDSSGQQVNIEYTGSGYNTTLTQSQTMIYTPPGAVQWKLEEIELNTTTVCSQSLYVLPAINGMGGIVSSNQHVSGNQIKRIFNTDPNNNVINEINFTYNLPTGNDFNSLKELYQNYKGKKITDFTFDYDLTSKGRLFLKTISNQKDISKYSFEYLNKNDFPERLSTDTAGEIKVCYSRDIWGLYNGADNNNLIPQIFDQTDFNAVIYDGANQEFNESKGYYGLLNRITYPTGGSTEIIYEPHKKDDFQITHGPKKNVYLNVSSSINPRIVTKTITITPKKDEFIPFNAFASFNEGGDCTEDTGHSGGILTIKDINGNFVKIYTYSTTFNTYFQADGTEYGSLNIIPNYVFTQFYLNLKKDIPVTFELKTKSGCSNSAINFEYTNGYDTTQEVQKPFGGFRIKSTIDTPITGSSIIRNYTYINENNKSSVNVTREPYFLEQQMTRSYCGSASWNDLSYYSLTSSNINQLVSLNPNIFYGTVAEEIVGKGKIIHHFNTNTDYFGKTLIGKDIATAPWANFGWDNGKELSTDYFDNSLNMLKNVTYNYIQDKNRESYTDGISFRKNFDLKVTGYATKKCTFDDINHTWTDYYCDTNHNHVWTALPWYNYWICTASGHHNTSKIYHDVCYGHNVEETIINPNVFENMDFVQYKNISRFDYLQSQTTTDYLNGKPVVTKTEYFYNNPSHYQLTSQTTTFPDNSVQVSNYQYAQEKNNQYLIDKNMVGIPLQTTVTKNNLGISSVETQYPTSQTDANTKTSGLPLPTSVISYDIQIPGTSSSSTTEITYDSYDSKGNILQYTTKSGVSTAIIWGYNQTQPIAKIEGATYAQVSALAPAIVTASDSDASQVPNNDESGFLVLLDAFRKSLPDFQVTTYTYDPLIGVRSVTPPSGIRENYIYDSANRLQSVQDMNGNILKEYQYNYKP